MQKILIIDDEIHILEFLKINLKAYGYNVKTYENANSITDICLSFKPDILLLDIMLPGKNGFEVCKEIRENLKLKNIGIIFLSAKDSEEDKIGGLDLGADDYITKPFSIKELHSRINSLFRRIQNKHSLQNFYYKNLEFNFNTCTAYNNGKKIYLTIKELKLLEYLILNFGKIVSRDTILEKIWNKDDDFSSRSLDVYIRKLRMKLDEESQTYSIIETIHGKGYKLG